MNCASVRAGIATWAVAGIMLAPVGACAVEATGCAAFKWPIDQEQAWLAAKAMPALASGASIAELSPGAFVITMAEASAVAFVKPPQGKPRADSSKGAMLTVGGLKTPGHYQITLSDEAWVDVIQDGGYVNTYDHSGAKDCPGVRKSLRFELKQGPLVLQFSAAAVTHLGVAIKPLD